MRLSRPRDGGGAATPSDMSRVRGVVLAGTYHWSNSSFEELLPRPLVPVAQAPLVSYALRWLRDGGIPRATLCANSASRAVRLVPGRRQPPDHEPRVPRGLDAPRRRRLRARRRVAQRRRHARDHRRHRHPGREHRPAARRPPQRQRRRHHRGPPRPARARRRAAAEPGRHLRVRPAGARPHPRDRLPGHQGDAHPEAVQGGRAHRDARGARRLPARAQRRDLPGDQPLDGRAGGRRSIAAGALGRVRGERAAARAPDRMGRARRAHHRPRPARPFGQDRCRRDHRRADQPGPRLPRGRGCARLALRRVERLPDRRRGRGRWLRPDGRRGRPGPHAAATTRSRSAAPDPRRPLREDQAPASPHAGAVSNPTPIPR